jgi:hypothetical protein
MVMNRNVEVPYAEKVDIIYVNIFSLDLNITHKEIRMAEQITMLNILACRKWS